MVPEHSPLPQHPWAKGSPLLPAVRCFPGSVQEERSVGESRGRGVREKTLCKDFVLLSLFQE